MLTDVFFVLHKTGDMGTDAGIIRYSMHHSILVKQDLHQRALTNTTTTGGIIVHSLPMSSTSD